MSIRKGIDLGIKYLVVTSDGIKYSNEKVLTKYEKRLKRSQRKLSRQVKGSKNYLKTKEKIYYKISTYYPSSQICSHCGYKNSKLKDLSIREYECPECGSHNDRDINASLNILYERLKVHYNLVSLV